MAAPKRDFGAFAYDYNLSNSSLPGSLSLLNTTEVGSHAQRPSSASLVSRLTATNPHIPATVENAGSSLDARYFDHARGRPVSDQTRSQSPALEPSTQELNSSWSDQHSRSHRHIQDKNICYGMIYLTRAKLIGSMTDVVNELTSLKEEVKSHCLLDVVWSNQELFVTLPSGLKAAQLNQQVSAALQNYVQCDKVMLQTLTHKETILNDIGKATSSKHSEISVNINVYGTSSMIQDVGSCLSQNEVWLQHPGWHRYGSVYDNPHVICFEKAGLSGVDAGRESANTACQELPQLSLEDIYSKLSRANHQKGVAGDFRLATKLLAHQEKALGFMLQREQGSDADEFQLWVEEMVSGVTRYRHKITGDRASIVPNEYGGGILADEMGTGKTLSAIALVLATREAAKTWTRDREAHLLEDILLPTTLSPATLVVVSSPLLLANWQKQLQKHMKAPLDVFVYHGTTRDVDLNFLAAHDIVLTTYHTLLADSVRNVTLITQIAWYRIILDEAHIIRRTSTALHKRVAELDAKFRWCLTGTPIQNSLDDLGALFVFLKIAPFDHLGCYRKHISTKYAEIHGMAEAQKNLLQLLNATCIRQTKDQVSLFPVKERHRPVEFSPNERIQYNAMQQHMKRAMDNIVGVSDSRRRFGSFQVKLQLRLLCNHGTYEDYFHWAKPGNLLAGYAEGLDGTIVGGQSACSICKQFDLMAGCGDDLVDMDSCVHTLCTECKQKSPGQCPLCDHGVSLGTTGYSSKMNALVQDLLACHEDKSIVFSCWTTTLELIARYLHQNNIRFEQIDGRMSLVSRQKILEAFSSDENIAVLIMTTGVGALGLDIITANRVFLVEPQWNPSVESQAIGRTTRIGQQKTVEVTRYIVRGTVEEDFRSLQDRKRNVARMVEKNDSNNVIKAEHQHNVEVS